MLYICLLALPLLNACITGFCGNKIGRLGCTTFSVYSILIAFLLSTIIFYEVSINSCPVYIKLQTWVDSGILNINWGFNFDSLTVTMCCVVHFISFLVHLYSIEYMKHDRHLPRFMSYLSLFTFFMLILVTADNFIQMFVGWEGVGLCSYLLINFWYTRIQANKAAIKAMIINRIGDFGLIIGISIIFINYKTVDYSTVFALTPLLKDKTINLLNFNINLLLIIGSFLFVGAIGKSAQLGLHTWLPDAMEGPTPVSALIHAATMVTAGVFLLARCSPIYELTDYILEFIILLGSITSFFASTIGLLQNDLKKVVAYSTCSQLGYMIFICGLSQYSVGVFHLINHAFFKALLFLGAGSVIHGLMDEQDMRKMGGLKRLLPITYSAMTIGSLSLIGFSFLAGFYSKDLILEIAFGHFSYYLGTFSAFLTTFYSTRLLFLTLLFNPNGYKPIIENITESQSNIRVVPSIFPGFFFKDNMGHGPESKKFIPFILSLFYVILLFNLIGLIPYSFTLTNRLNVTFLLSFSVFVGTSIICFQKHSYKIIELILHANTSFLLIFKLIRIRFVSYISEPVSFGVRFFISNKKLFICVLFFICLIFFSLYLLPLEPVLCAADEYGKNLPTPPESPIEWRPVATRTLLAGITYGVLVRLGLPAQFALAGSAVIMFGPNVVSFLGRTYGPFFKGTPKMRELHLLESSKGRLSNSSFAKQLFYISPVIVAGESIRYSLGVISGSPFVAGIGAYGFYGVMSWLQSDQFGNFWANFWQSPPREKPERDNTKKEPEIGNFTQILSKQNSVILDAGKEKLAAAKAWNTQCREAVDESWRQWHIEYEQDKRLRLAHNIANMIEDFDANNFRIGDRALAVEHARARNNFLSKCAHEDACCVELNSAYINLKNQGCTILTDNEAIKVVILHDNHVRSVVEFEKAVKEIERMDQKVLEILAQNQINLSKKIDLSVVEPTDDYIEKCLISIKHQILLNTNHHMNLPKDSRKMAIIRHKQIIKQSLFIHSCFLVIHHEGLKEISREKTLECIKKVYLELIPLIPE